MRLKKLKLRLIRIKLKLKSILGEIYLSEEELTLLKLMNNKNTITQKQMHEEMGISLATIKRILPRLQKKGVLQRIASRKSGKWLVNCSEDRNREVL